MKEIFDIAAEEFETIGLCLAVGGFGIIRNNLRNVPEKEPGLTGRGPTPARRCRNSSPSQADTATWASLHQRGGASQVASTTRKPSRSGRRRVW